MVIYELANYYTQAFSFLAAYAALIPIEDSTQYGSRYGFLDPNLSGVYSLPKKMRL
jgi:hypothetical protein